MADRAEDPRPKRHAENKARILKAAWKIAEREGVAGISLGELAKKVGLRQPSLYTYFDSKNGLYDEMFADGNRLLLATVVDRDYEGDPDEALKRFVRACIDFSSAHPAQHALLFQRHIPGFVPSHASYALAQEFYEFVRVLWKRAGITRQEDMDVFASLTQGLSDQQVSNEPHGQRWAALVDDVVDSYLDRVRSGGFRRKGGTKR
jgi:AcrR family transcriptional regulator